MCEHGPPHDRASQQDMVQLILKELLVNAPIFAAHPTRIPPVDRVVSHERVEVHSAREPDRVLTTLAHLSDEDLLREAYRHTRQSSAPGIEGVTAQRSADHLDANLHDVHARLRSGR